MLIAFQNKLIYMGYIPMGSRHERFVKDETLHLQVEEHAVSTPDGHRLRGFIAHGPVQNNGPIIIYFQGNAGNMIHRLPLFKTMMRAVPNATVVGICYRGYGSSTGRANEKGLLIDAEAIYNDVKQRYPERSIYLYGHSLGGAVAVHLAAQSHISVRGVILENTFTSILDMVKAMYPRYTPYPLIAKYFLWNHWRSESVITQVKAPILFLSSEKDEIVPYAHMQKLCERVKDRAVFQTFRKSTHMDIFVVESTRFITSIRDFIQAREGTL
ncbi:Alpha/Beta hydrolase protein [Radiomyces spectabilis]|uniref:Alpha/Beta hydrolase protein n=1 Tax=Radiomyces spectabilis TaxID=64574 RepID=UPI0022208E1B|nr:Alpha/Beta hydrolase protein [Radiomyces spectabilis]KAI8368183.1 Alpha/Beta hydrolase protein [Radiomyces spectabilis]